MSEQVSRRVSRATRPARYTLNSATQHWHAYLPTTLQAVASFDALFDSVPAAELQQAMEAVMRQREPRREIVKVD